jgi:hypothetical protein
MLCLLITDRSPNSISSRNQQHRQQLAQSLFDGCGVSSLGEQLRQPPDKALTVEGGLP